MSKKLRLDHKTGFQNTFYTKCINVIIDSIGPSIILSSIYLCHKISCRLKMTTEKAYTVHSFYEPCLK